MSKSSLFKRFGHKIPADFPATAIAADSDGEVFAYKGERILCDGSLWWDKDNDNDCVFIGNMKDGEKFDWKNSLELIPVKGKPFLDWNGKTWDDAPEWARYRAYDFNGCWFWYESKPLKSLESSEWQYGEFDYKIGGLIDGEVPQWQETLEERPSQETAVTAQQRFTDNQAVTLSAILDAMKSGAIDRVDGETAISIMIAGEDLLLFLRELHSDKGQQVDLLENEAREIEAIISEIEDGE